MRLHLSRSKEHAKSFHAYTSPVQYTEAVSGKLARAKEVKVYFTGSSLMVQCRLALGTDGQAVQLAVTFSLTA